MTRRSEFDRAAREAARIGESERRAQVWRLMAELQSTCFARRSRGRRPRPLRPTMPTSRSKPTPAGGHRVGLPSGARNSARFGGRF